MAKLTYTSGACRVFYRGNIPPGQLPQGDGSQPVTTTAWWSSISGSGLLSGAGLMAGWANG